MAYLQPHCKGSDLGRLHEALVVERNLTKIITDENQKGVGRMRKQTIASLLGTIRDKRQASPSAQKEPGREKEGPRKFWRVMGLNFN